MSLDIIVFRMFNALPFSGKIRVSFVPGSLATGSECEAETPRTNKCIGLDCFLLVGVGFHIVLIFGVGITLYLEKLNEQNPIRDTVIGILDRQPNQWQP